MIDALDKSIAFVAWLRDQGTNLHGFGERLEGAFYMIIESGPVNQEELDRVARSYGIRFPEGALTELQRGIQGTPSGGAT